MHHRSVSHPPHTQSQTATLPLMAERLANVGPEAAAMLKVQMTAHMVQRKGGSSPPVLVKQLDIALCSSVLCVLLTLCDTSDWRCASVNAKRESAFHFATTWRQGKSNIRCVACTRKRRKIQPEKPVKRVRPDIDNAQTRKLRSAQLEEPPVPGMPSMQKTNGVNHDTTQASNSAAVLEEAELDEDEQYEMNSQPQGAYLCCYYLVKSVSTSHGWPLL